MPQPNADAEAKGKAAEEAAAAAAAEEAAKEAERAAKVAEVTASKVCWRDSDGRGASCADPAAVC